MITAIIAFFVSAAAGLIGVPVFSAMGRRFGLVDLPDNKRKLHQSAIPLVGGIAVFAAVLLTVPVVTWIGAKFQTEMLELTRPLATAGWGHFGLGRLLKGVLMVRPIDYWEVSGLMLGCLIILLVGVLDDRYGIRGRQKLFGQFVATSVLIFFGYHFDKVTVAGFTIRFDVFSVLFVYGWVIAAVNSVNLLDGADGIAGTVGVVMSAALGVMTLHQGQVLNSVVAFSFAGALVGFLKFNFPPAKVYLGDAGSMLIGFALSALAMRSLAKQTSAFAFFAPLALLAIPFIDTIAAIVRRRLTGRSIFEVDRGHLHHSLMKRGLSPRASVMWVFALTLTTATGGVLSLMNHRSHFALASIAVVVVVMLWFGIFGNAEFQLITRKSRGLARVLLKPNLGQPTHVQESIVHVQGNRDWGDTWQRLTEFADKFGLYELTLDLNAPWIHESFHATQKRKDISGGGNHEWFVQIPLIAGQRLYGRIELVGTGLEPSSHHEIIHRLCEVTQGIETELLSLEKKPEHPPGDSDSATARQSPLQPERRSAGSSGSAEPAVTNPIAAKPAAKID